MNKRFKILFWVFIFFLFLGAFFVFASFSRGFVVVGYSVLLIDLIIGLVLLSVFIETKGLARLPERIVSAKVIAKNIKKEWVSDGNGGWDKYYYIVTFQSDCNEIWAFPLSLELYNGLLPGDRGTLIYKTNKKGNSFFFSFTRS